MNQIEVHPYFQQTALQQRSRGAGILTQAWSPIGGITSYRGMERRTFDDPTLRRRSRSQHGKSPAQVMLRWHLQEGRPAIPKSTKPARIAENFDGLRLRTHARGARSDRLARYRNPRRPGTRHHHARSVRKTISQRREGLPRVRAATLKLVPRSGPPQPEGTSEMKGRSSNKVLVKP